MPRQKLRMLPPRLKELAPRLPMVKTYRAKQDNGRTLTLTNAPWKRLRVSVLAGEPLCRHCTARGLTVAATEVDHRDNDPSNNDLINLQPLCHSCHSRKTNADMGHRVSMGCDASGMPRDTDHHWNKSPATVQHKPTCSHDVNANRENEP